MKTGFLLSALLLFCALLCGQEAPLLLSGEPLQLPPQWTRRYDPPEVLIRVKVLPDSILSLVEVLDGKSELIPYLADHLSLHKYALGDTLGVSQTFDAVLAINQLPQEESTAAPRIDEAQLLAGIEAWVKDTREAQDPRRPLRSPVSAPLSLSPEPYRAGFFLYGRGSEQTSLTINGFQPVNSIYSSSLIDNYLAGSLSRQNQALSDSWGEPSYPYEAAVSDIEVGIGDYEHRFARGSIRKNQLFGLNRLYLAFDFLVQGGYWLEQDSDRDALKLFLNAPLGPTDLELGFSDQNSQLSMLTLRPEYWRSNNFTIERRYRTLYAAWKSPWLNLALLNENDTSRSPEFESTLHSDALQLQAWKTLRIKNLGITALYGHCFFERDFGLADQDHEDLARLGLEYRSSFINADLSAGLLDFARPILDGDLRHEGRKLGLGAFFRYQEPQPGAWLFTPNIYAGPDSLPRVDIREKLDLGAYLSYKLAEDSRLQLTAGQRQLETRVPQSVDENVPYLRLGADIIHSWANWQLDWTPGLTWQGADSNLPNEPNWEWASHLTLSRLLSHNNALFAGFSLTGHDAFRLATPAFFETGASLLADVWAGVRITDRFELAVIYKNVTDSNLYGVYPLPASLHATLRWFYLN